MAKGHTIGEQLGLGRYWGLTRFAWSWARVRGGGKLAHVLVLEGQAGTVGVPFSDEDLQRLITAAQAELSGLIRATEADLATGVVIPLGAVEA